MVRGLSQFFIGPIGGVLADCFNRKNLLIAADIARALVVIGFLFVRESGDVWMLYLFTGLQLGISGIFNPTKDAILPDVVEDHEIGTANAIIATTFQAPMKRSTAPRKIQTPERKSSMPSNL